MLRNRGIAFKLVTLFIASSTLIFAVIFGYNYYVSRRMVEEKVKENAREILSSTVYRIEAVLRPAEKVGEGLANFMENGTYDEDELMQVLFGTMEKNPPIHGVRVAFEPYAFNKKIEAFAPYFYREYEAINFQYSDRHDNYYLKDWYQIPRELGTPQWTEPYFGTGGGGLAWEGSVG